MQNNETYLLWDDTFVISDDCRLHRSGTFPVQLETPENQVIYFIDVVNISLIVGNAILDSPQKHS